MFIVLSLQRNPRDLLRWVNYYFNLGFDKIIIGDDSSQYPINYNDDRVEIRRYTHGNYPNNLYNDFTDLQKEFYTEVAEEYRGDNWMFVCDDDEYLKIPTNNIKSYVANYPENTAAISFNWMHIGFNYLNQRAVLPLYVNESINSGWFKTIHNLKSNFTSVKVHGLSGVTDPWFIRQSSGRIITEHPEYCMMDEIDFRNGYVIHEKTMSFEELLVRGIRNKTSNIWYYNWIKEIKDQIIGSINLNINPYYQIANLIGKDQLENLKLLLDYYATVDKVYKSTVESFWYLHSLIAIISKCNILVISDYNNCKDQVNTLLLAAEQFNKTVIINMYENM